MKQAMVYNCAIAIAFCFLYPLNISAQAPEVKYPVYSDVSIPLRDMKPVKKSGGEKEEREIPNKFRTIVPLNPNQVDGALQTSYPTPLGPMAPLGNPIVNFEGSRNGNNSGRVDPPDPVGDVGPNHYVQVVNCVLQVFNKTGVSLFGPVNTSTLWNGFTGAWTGHNDGDAIVLYDENADRWLISQFAIDCGGSPQLEYELVAISTTSDPTGSYYRYAFQFDYMPDYPKIGVWQDGYYMAVNRFNTNSGGIFVGAGACVMERNKMLTGDPSARMIYFKTETLGGSGSGAGSNCWSMLPSDCDGTFPASGTPNYFVYIATTELRLWALHVDWTTTSNSTFTYVTALPVATYTALGTQTAVPQPGTAQKLDGLGDRLMFRNQYRNFGTYESFLTSHSVTSAGIGGMRWYEYRRTSGAFSMYQQGTYAPGDGKYRWMGSVAMNAIGDIGLIYTVSNSSTYPSIYFTGRKASDPLGQMTIPEGIIQTGTLSITGASRWGDYSALNIDPSDNITFWGTHEYIGTYGGTWPWATKIASFNFNGPPTVVTTAASNVTNNSATLNGTINPNGSASTYYFDWGTSISYGNTTTVTAAGSGTSNVNVSANLNGLTSMTTYHYRLVGTNSYGTTYGNDMTFTPGLVLISVSGSNGADGSYLSLTQAGGAFATINSYNQSGKNIIITINGDVTTEDGSNSLTGVLGMWNSLTIKPSGIRTVSGNVSGKPIIDLNGADYVTIDGLTTLGNSLTIINYSTSTANGTSTIRLTGGAVNNIIQNCTISGSSVTNTVSTNSNADILFTNGNNTGNTISNCNIGDASSNTPSYLIYSSTSGINSNNSIINCNIFNWFNAGSFSSGIELDAGNTDWIIQGNSFYQTSTRNLGAYETNPIAILNSTSGNNFNISNNYIGGQSAQCGGNAMTYTGGGGMEAILLSAAASTPSTVQGNIIKNISFTTSSIVSFQTGISVDNGACTIQNNQIGDPSTTSNITFSATSTGNVFHGICVGAGSTGTQTAFTISNNIIGGISLTTSAAGSTQFRGINLQSSGGLNNSTLYNITGNTIGSTVTTNCVSNSTSGGVAGIMSFAGGASTLRVPVTITNNVIANLNITSASALQANALFGIYTQGNGTSPNYYGVYATAGNMILNLNSAGTYNGLSISGIYNLANSDYGQSISKNIVYSLANTSTTNITPVIYGIYYQVYSSNDNIVEKNFIHSLSLSATGNGSSIYGIYINSGTSNIQNNFIRIGIDGLGNSISRGYNIYGIYEAAGPSNLYFNSIYIGGSVTSGTNSSYAFNSNLTTGTRTYENNILDNQRSGNGSVNYAIRLRSGGTIVSNYNDLLSATTLGRYNNTTCASLANWRSTSGQDANSISADPLFVNATGNSGSVDLHITNQYSLCKAAGTTIATVTDDIDNDTRHNPPDIGADEFQFTGPYIWVGGAAGNTNNWFTTSNWNPSKVPTSVDGVTIPAGRTYYPVITSFNQAKCNTANIDNGATVTIWSTGSLTVTGTLTLSGTECLIIKSDASGTGAIQFGSLAGTGTARVEKYETPAVYHYITPPVSYALSGIFHYDYLRYYDEVNGAWSIWIVPTTIVITPPVIKGYEVWRPLSNTATKIFSGPLNNGNLSISLTNTLNKGGGWNLIGNPFACPIDLMSSAITWTNIDKTVYYWNSAGGNYLSFVVGAGAGTGSRYCPAMQGFFVHVNSTSGGTFGVNNPAMALNQQLFYKMEEIASPAFCIVATSEANAYYDKTLVIFNQDATGGFSPALDAYKWTGNSTAPQLYTKADSISVCVNSMPYNGIDMVIPLYFSCSLNGDYTLSFDNTYPFPQGKNIWIEDKKLHKLAEFSPEKPYRFYYNAGENAGRFILHFRKVHVTDSPDNLPQATTEPGNAGNLQIYSYEKTVYVRNDNPGLTGDVFIYNILGNKVFSGKMEVSTINSYTTDLPEGIYIVKVMTPGCNVNQKVVLR